jgi:hypothetical protein
MLSCDPAPMTTTTSPSSVPFIRSPDQWLPTVSQHVTATARKPTQLKNRTPENMTEQAERPLKLKDESRTVDICGPKWPEHGPETQIDRGLQSPNSHILQRCSCVERVTGIEPALSAWELFELMGFVLGSLRVSRSRAAWSGLRMPAVMAR